MRFLSETLLVAGGLALYGVLQAAIGARELATIPPTTRMPELPTSNSLGLAGSALSVVAYGLLGRAIARAGLAPGWAARRGALAGLLAGAASGLAQSAWQGDFFRAVALAYSLPEVVAQLVQVLVAIVSPIAGAAIGAAVCWLAAILSRPARPGELS